MANNRRIYAVFEKGEPIALVRAASQAAAISHAVEGRFEAIVADQDHCITLAAKGMKVQEAGAKAEEAPQ